MATDYRKEYLGKGISFPLQVNSRGELSLVTGERDIEQSIRIILATRPGERVMRPEMGCRAYELMFEPRDSATATLLEMYVREALTRWEPRIDILNVIVSLDSEQDNTLIAEIFYYIKTTHDQRSIVYPFYLAGQENW